MLKHVLGIVDLCGRYSKPSILVEKFLLLFSFFFFLLFKIFFLGDGGGGACVSFIYVPYIERELSGSSG